jgi:hypothetical protein
MMAAGFEIEGVPARADVNTAAMINIVSPGYVHAIGVPLISGRSFTPLDSADAPKVVILPSRTPGHQGRSPGGAAVPVVGNREQGIGNRE